MGNNSWMGSPFFSRHLVPQNVGNIIFVCYFLNIGLGPAKSQWSRHFSKKSIPGLFYSKPPRKVSATALELRTTKLKKPPPDFPRISHGFPKDFPWISYPLPSLNFRGGRGSGRQISSQPAGQPGHTFEFLARFGVLF